VLGGRHIVTTSSDEGAGLRWDGKRSRGSPEKKNTKGKVGFWTKEDAREWKLGTCVAGVSGKRAQGWPLVWGTDHEARRGIPSAVRRGSNNKPQNPLVEKAEIRRTWETRHTLLEGSVFFEEVCSREFVRIPQCCRCEGGGCRQVGEGNCLLKGPGREWRAVGAAQLLDTGEAGRDG